MLINNTVRIRTKQSTGPLLIRRRVGVPTDPANYRIEVYDWNFDNGFAQVLPVDYWESLKGEFVDRRNNLRYSDLLVEL